MTTTLITGGTKGLGREAARRLLALGHHVIIGARDAAKGRAVAEELGADWVELDVTSDASVATAARQVREQHRRLDVLVNNAGIPGPFVSPVIVNVSSGLGSFTARADESRPEHGVPSLACSASKAAVSMLTTVYAESIPDVRINAVDPGPTATDLNGGRGSQTVTEGTDAIVAMATIGPDGPTGTFIDRHGVLGW